LQALLIILFLVTNATVLYRNSCAHHMQLKLLDTERKDHSELHSAVKEHMQLLDVDLRLHINPWLEFAERDAALHGVVVSDTCNLQHGSGFLGKFKTNCGVLCGQLNSNLQHLSSVECCAYPVEERGLACWASNILVNATAFLGPKVAKGHQEHSTYAPVGLAGSVGVDCHMYSLADAANGTVWSTGGGNNVRKELLPWFTSALDAKNPGIVQTSCQGHAHVVHHPVLFVTRLDTTNPYHHMQVNSLTVGRGGLLV
jgi:hypothetical protein